MKKKPHVGDRDTEVLMKVYKDITGASVSVEITKPDGTVDTKGAQVYSVNIVRYKTAATDFDKPGIYYFQPLVTLKDSTWEGHGDRVAVEVLD